MLKGISSTAEQSYNRGYYKVTSIEFVDDDDELQFIFEFLYFLCFIDEFLCR